MYMSRSDTPFITLGQRLKYVREQSEQSLAEVSGAVEIDETLLQRFESGRERPSEDILLLLISHFDIQEQEAVQLWELADYKEDVPEQLRSQIDINTSGKPVLMLLALDTRAVYSDGIDIETTKAGLTLSFTQSGGPSKELPVAKVGMSVAQAEKVLNTLQQAILKAKYHQGPKQLPPKI